MSAKGKYESSPEETGELVERGASRQTASPVTQGLEQESEEL